MEKKIANIENHINEYFNYLDKEDKTELHAKGSTSEQIKAAIKELEERKEKYTGYLETLEEAEKLKF